jgi:putative lipoprotein
MDELIRVALLLNALGGTPGAAVPEPRTPAAAQQPQQPAPVQTGDAWPGASGARPGAGDAWLGADKFRHFWMSYATTAFAFASARAAGQDTDTALRIAIPVAGTAGIGKEIRDLRTGRGFSARDLVADALGIAGAYFLLREVR